MGTFGGRIRQVRTLSAWLALATLVAAAEATARDSGMAAAATGGIAKAPAAKAPADKSPDRPAATAAQGAAARGLASSAGGAGDARERVNPDAWAADEIVRAQALCAQVLERIEAVVMPLEPIKDGECGTPAPVLLFTVGRNPEVVVSPPPTLTCDMVAALADWLEQDLQPAARRLLGAPVIKIEAMSSYSCRNAYGRRMSRLSEHGRANALDIRRFVTASLHADVLEGWGPTERDIRAAQVAAEKAAAEAAAKLAANQPKGGAEPASGNPPPGAPVAAPATAAHPALAGQRLDTLVEALAAPVAKGTVRAATSGMGFGFSAPSRLNGPKPRDAAPAAPEKIDARALFLRGAHQSACRRFGTVLGPEANEAHRNHLHIDLAVRATSSYCE
jgi:hypothetical protein